MSSTSLTVLETPIVGLYATPPATLPFDPSVDVRAFLLERADVILLFYNAPGLATAAAEIHTRGGAVGQFINHSHEAMFGPQGIDTGVFVHERDRAETITTLAIEGTFSERHMIGDDFEVIPIPGHTPGATAFLWDNGQHRFLFTGDSLWLDNNEWRAVVLGSSDRRAYLDSLTLLRELQFDVLVPWGATANHPYVAVVSHDQAQQAIDTVIERVERGGYR
jgi:hypothetical protein